MIRYALICARKHEFESWFANSAAFDKQLKRGLVECPICGSEDVEKAIMSPQVTRTDRPRPRRVPPPADSAETPAPAAAPAAPAVPELRAPVAMMGPLEREFRQKLKELREHVTRNAENVGGRFPEEARKMHYGETEHRSIYGEASPEEAKELHEEGIDFHPLPLLPDEHN